MPSKRGQDRSHLLGGVSDHNTLIEFDQATYGEISQVDAGRQIAEPISIFEIYPDLAQPRRAVPSEVRIGWDGLPDGVPTLLQRWMSGSVPEDQYQPFVATICDLIQEVSERNFDTMPQSTSIEASFLKIVEVASGIYRDGLINPVTVARARHGYRLETGERRWLAYHLLHLLFEDAQWARIPARLVEIPNVWRQAAENGQRQNLNTVARARQFAILMMALHDDISFTDYSSCKSDRIYYAQALALDIPYGKREKILMTMSISSPAMLTTYRKVLSLPDEVWTRADDENWSEAKITKLFSTLNDLGNAPPAPPVDHNQARLFSRENKPNISRIEKLFLKAGQGDQRASENLLSQIEQHRQWLDELERVIRDRS